MCRNRDFNVVIGSWAVRVLVSQPNFGVATRGAELLGKFYVATQCSQ